ncbi:uncharacterized protein UTRI_06494_B [Ustilago trichophora]|uniref:Methyltransferase domain-containing protein n=1 Tax=Ustilago trichophora TaxID=86804 RepID=A0A5C3EMQ9_9BASI|nr:uncharacterized protein UTRI_06494_B [Ustilago trichophora]
MAQTRAEQLFNIKAIDVAAHHLQPTSQLGKQDSVQSIQTSHRLDILYAWLTGADPTTSSSSSEHVEADYSLLSGNVMDLGCGQGDQTGALAALLAAHPDRFNKDARTAKVVGVDPAPPTYGSPYTLQQAQEHLSSSTALSNHLEFLLGNTGPEALKMQTFNTVVLSHSSWYFPSAQILNHTLRAIKKAGVKHLLLAEWAMTASHPNAVPHLLAALLQAQSPIEGGNVQTPLSAEQLKQVALDAGWKVHRELAFLPAEKLHDGAWEIDIAREAADQALKLDTGRDRIAQKLVRSVQATRYALDETAKRCATQIRSMDVWTAVLTPA